MMATYLIQAFTGVVCLTALTIVAAVAARIVLDSMDRKIKRENLMTAVYKLCRLLSDCEAGLSREMTAKLKAALAHVHVMYDDGALGIITAEVLINILRHRVGLRATEDTSHLIDKLQQVLDRRCVTKALPHLIHHRDLTVRLSDFLSELGVKHVH